MIERIPPQNIEAEQAVLGAMLIKKEAVIEAMEILRPEDFYRDAHRVVFEAIMAVFQNDSAVDMITVTEQLKKSDLLDKAGGVAGVTALANAVPTAANVVYHAKIVREKAELRELINAGSEITGWAFEDSDDVDAVMDKAEKRILEVTARENSADFTSMKDIVISVFKQIEERSTNKGGLTGVASGFTDLDRLTSGFQPSDLILVAARPSMGKTAFTLNIASYVAVHLDKPVAFFSLEMSKEQLAQRMLCSEGGIDSQRLRNGDMKDEDWEHVIAAADRLTYAPVFIDDTPGITVMELRSKARRIKAEHGLSMVIIDYLQLMSGKGSKNGDNRQQEISEISRSLKALARELKVPVIALSQLSRSVESRQVKRPMLSDLRESGSLEQDADIVMFLYREDYYDKETEQQNVTEVIVAKHRNGPIDTVRLYFDKEFTRFANFAGNIPDQ
ncbi:replicative DNA helicase [Schwartzia succinivorans]|jgi:replicative DNA helicase|uniref:Replicative DNA helicase n=1 Tax=Schwartzia succinivorans DSM 10502 TaxID=1123243 RepID=A0A1M5ABH6_9FIRM|nr:replicative DNA helicase [Schwartzia succinivorans]MDY6294910.1 replicative DNA helicase [Schwartzia succinivorans]SHF27525.1 replicative DNA helicase [Schwartzia succinivorans DSM 10502]